MLIAVDIGNSSINIGYFAGSGLMVRKVATHPLKTPQEYAAVFGDFLSSVRMEKEDFGVIICSVVDGHTPVIADALKRLTGLAEGAIVVAANSMRSGIKLNIAAPADLGTDRLADAVGAVGLYGAPVAVLSFGTATAITVVDEDASCIGGAIMPGIGLMNNSLVRGTARLKGIGMEPASSALGKDTAGCIRSGIFFGTAGGVERILSEIERETGRTFRIVITGGYAGLISNLLLRNHEINPHLTLEGLKILYEENRPS